LINSVIEFGSDNHQFTEEEIVVSGIMTRGAQPVSATIFNILERTNIICTKIKGQFTKRLRVFKGKYDTKDLSCMDIVEFLQFTVWTYLKFKCGIYPIDDAFLKGNFYSDETYDFKSMLQQELGVAYFKLLNELDTLALDAENLKFTKYCFNYVKHFPAETEVRIVITNTINVL
jgi:hypothetical protein